MKVSFTVDGVFCEVTKVHTILHRGNTFNLYYDNNARKRISRNGQLEFDDNLEHANVMQLNPAIDEITVTK